MKTGSAPEKHRFWASRGHLGRIGGPTDRFGILFPYIPAVPINPPLPMHKQDNLFPLNGINTGRFRDNAGVLAGASRIFIVRVMTGGGISGADASPAGIPK
jgi:hypothetical protein